MGTDYEDLFLQNLIKLTYLMIHNIQWTKNNTGRQYEKKQCCTSRPARVSNTVPKPPAVNHLCVEKPNSSINNDAAATQTVAYTPFPAKSKATC